MEEGVSTRYPQAGGGKREGKSLSATLRGNTHTTFPVRAANSQGSRLPARRRQPARSPAPLTAASGRRRAVPLGGRRGGFPTFLRGAAAMRPWRSAERGRSRERGQEREQGRRRGARAGLAGAGSAGGAKPPEPPPPLHWSRALPICRHRPGTLPAAPWPQTSPAPAPRSVPGVHSPPPGSSSRSARGAGLGVPPGHEDTPPPQGPQPSPMPSGGSTSCIRQPCLPLSQHPGGVEAGRSCPCLSFPCSRKRHFFGVYFYSGLFDGERVG